MELVSKKVLTLEIARALVFAAEREIAAHGWAMFVAIVDETGAPLVVERVDDAQPASYQVAIDKAACAARFRRPTKVFADRLQGGALHLLTVPGVIAVEGGVPLVSGDCVIGAVGISGGTGSEDGIVAAAAVQAFSDVVRVRS